MIDRAEAGARLRIARERRGLSQSEAAELLGIKREQLSKVETGARGLLWTTLHEWVRVLGLEPHLIAAEWFAAPTPRRVSKPGTHAGR